MSFDFDRPLADLPPGAEGVLVRIHGGPGTALRLRRLGLRPGARVRALASGPFGGPVLVDVNGCRVAIGRGLARRVLVRTNGSRDGG
ncbi:MAG: ferrous iron transport protein A [Candidatus Bipolaricaulota bacterium]|nr:ferrous iron transport protein A [Candidatus Bipolaricaulota bacterium]